jgi:hypothetical protein
MSVHLHILTRPEDAVAAEVIAIQRQGADREIRVVDLTQPEPDYAALLAEIFAADSVAVW